FVFSFLTLLPSSPPLYPYSALFRSRVGHVNDVWLDRLLRLVTDAHCLASAAAQSIGENVHGLQQLEECMAPRFGDHVDRHALLVDRKRTRLNSSQVKNSNAVFCLKK